MSNKNIFTIFALLYTLVFAGAVSAQNIPGIPIFPEDPSSRQEPAVQPRQPVLNLPPHTRPPLAETEQKTAIEQPREEELSEFEEYISGKIPLTISTDIRQFGYDFFRRTPSTFAPVENVPVGPSYVFGPGDKMRITAWGKIEGQWDVTVTRDGNISLPKIGVFSVTGLTFKELKKRLIRAFSKYYTGFRLHVTMTGLRSMTVYMVGNARRPGAYTISSLSTLLNAVFEAGGPSKTGTLRDIQVKRNGKTITHFDMYNLLLKGDKTKDIRLMAEDVIFIPPIGPLAAIAGGVRNPAIYEFKGKTTIYQLIQMAGGLTDVAFKGRVQIERITNNSRQTVFESNLAELKKKKTALRPGDLVKIFHIVQDRKVVRLTGAVQREGEYGFSPGMTVKDLISMAGGLKYYAYYKEAELTRIQVTNEGPVTEKIMIKLGAALLGEPESNITFMENDYLFVRSVPDWKLYQTVGIKGEIKFPGTYTIKKGEKLSSLIERAGGYTDNAYLKGAIFTRERVKELWQESLTEMTSRLETELLGSGAADISTSLTAAAARIKEAEIKQKKDFIAKLKSLEAKGRMAIILDQPEALKKTSYDIELEDGDNIFIPSDPQSVQVMGSVYNQTAFVYDKYKSYTNYIALAGGYSEGADKKRVYVLKIDGTAVRAAGGPLSISWDKSSHRWESGTHVVDSGDTIVVPQKLERIAWLREIKDITQILFRIAVTTGVILATF